MDACKMCWKTKEVSPVFAAYPRAVEFCKGCAFDIHRVVNALAYALDTSGFAIALVKRNLILLDLEKPGERCIDLLTGELVAGPNVAIQALDPDREMVRVFQEVSKGEVEGGSPEGGLEEGPSLPESPETPLVVDQEDLVDQKGPKQRRSK